MREKAENVQKKSGCLEGKSKEEEGWIQELHSTIHHLQGDCVFTVALPKLF